MQTIHIDVSDIYATKLINMLENLKGIMLEEIRVNKSIEIIDNDIVDLIQSQEDIMAKTWENEEDEAWNGM